ncbi:hypothetical protein GCM10022416_22580 [Actinomadura keratinilytica]|jgi:hypothetical protein|uniref:MFS transporter n=1 Tax=Actinomadura keratinilytica TaxID=547461 RepID=A0ABP7YN40_9ACTN
MTDNPHLSTGSDPAPDPASAAGLAPSAAQLSGTGGCCALAATGLFVVQHLTRP